MSSRPVTICCLCFAIIFICVGIAVLFGFPKVFKRQFNERVSLTNGSEVFKEWVNPGDDVPVFLKFHIFNYTNVHEILLKGSTPNVSEAGIVTYKEVLVKENVTFHNGSEKVEYKIKHTYVFDESRSTMKENDSVILPNFVLWTVLNSVEPPFDEVIDSLVNTLASEGNDTQKNAVAPFYKTTVADFIWAKHDNPFLALVHQEKSSVPTRFPLQANESYNGIHEVFTGYGHENRNRGRYVSWNHNKSLHYWGSEQCNAINGTDGSLFSTFMGRPRGLYIFNTQACRSFYLTPSNKVEAFNNIKTLKFSVPAEAFNVSYSDNRCFCPNFKQLKSNETCTGLDGLIDVSECQVEQIASKGMKPSDLKLNISVIMSSPHFLFATNETIHSVDGMKPDEKIHATYLNVEPDTGFLITGSKRLQFNTKLYHGDKTKNIDSLKNLTAGWSQLAPLFWVDEHLDVSESMTGKLEKEFFKPQNVVNFTSFGAIGVGIAILAIVTMILVFYNKPQQLHVVLDTDYGCEGGMDSLPGFTSTEGGAENRNRNAAPGKMATENNDGYTSD